MKIKTISRNRVKFIESLFASAVRCTAYTFHNNFIGASCPVDVIRRALFDAQCPGKLTYHVERDTYCVRIHSNLWYEFKVQAEHPACCGCAECEARYAA